MSDKEKSSAKPRSGSHPGAKDAPPASDPSMSTTTPIQETGASAELSAAKARIQQLEQEAKQAQDQYVRALAEFDNTKKRLQREKEEFCKYAAESVLRELLPIIDSLDHALVAVDKQADAQAIIKGVHLIYRQLLGLLQKEGVVRIPTVGEPFDPHKHEAVAQIDVDDEDLDGAVIEEVQVGYMMHGQVLRPAMVKVGKRSDQSSEVGGQRSEAQDQGPEDRSQRSEVGGLKSDQYLEDRDQKSEDRS